MIIGLPGKTCVKGVSILRGTFGGCVNNQFCVSYGHSKFSYAPVSLLKSNSNIPTIRFQSFRSFKKSYLSIPTDTHNVNIKLLMPSETKGYNLDHSVEHFSWQKCLVSAVFFSGLLVCCSNSGQVHAKAFGYKERKDNGCYTSVTYSHGKEVYADYSVIGIPGDGRCMFRSVAHGACLRSGKVPPDEKYQRQLADELREKVADEFIKRREETEWFIEGDFDKYVAQMREPHVWGGEPELLMASHVLRMPITVYMCDKDSQGLISIAEYGQEYGKDNPIRVLYHGYGHYDAVQIPGKTDVRSKL